MILVDKYNVMDKENCVIDSNFLESTSNRP